MNQLEAFKNIRAFIFDVDGVLTNSRLLVTEEGHLLRSMNTRDGFAIKQAVRFGFQVFIITGGNSNGVVRRLSGLGVSKIYAGIHDKMDPFEEILTLHQLDEDQILYMG
ncbi:MAG: 3-deoxy-D-manno-octulosonate 8-phosphate phosphatase, partial [Bacteroidetes bacterium]